MTILELFCLKSCANAKCVISLHYQNKRTMKTQFELKTWLSENRETVIGKYNKLTQEKFFNGITLKDFMLQVMSVLVRNNVKSEKTASKILLIALGEIYMNNSKVIANDFKTDALKAKYSGTAYMAMV
jgi:hypothetical protein